MPRPRSPQVIERAVKVYKILEEQGGRITTPELLKIVLSKGIANSYSLLHHTLMVLENAGFVKHERVKGKAEWYITKKATEDEVRAALSSR
jgi:Fe2+ or Zn2+ uptake regulation protein